MKLIITWETEYTRELRNRLSVMYAVKFAKLYTLVAITCMVSEVNVPIFNGLGRVYMVATGVAAIRLALAVSSAVRALATTLASALVFKATMRVLLAFDSSNSATAMRKPDNTICCGTGY